MIGTSRIIKKLHLSESYERLQLSGGDRSTVRAVMLASQVQVKILSTNHS